MGSIAIHLLERPETTDGVARAMAAAAPHRGDRIESVVLGGCAMAVANGAEHRDAMVAIADGLAIAVVGSVDNAAELARQLSAEAHDPLGDAGDAPDLAALIAAGWRRWGRDLPAHLRGVFSAAVSDGRWLACFRDQVGYRSLFYRRDATATYAATEAKQVLAGAGLAREPDLEVLERIYFRTLTDETPCAVRGVRRLPKATTLLVDGAEERGHRYWDPAVLLEAAPLRPDDLRSRFTHLLDQAVDRALTGSDVISLSGGIDSPAIAAAAAPRHRERFGRPLSAITVIYPRYPSVDESRYVMPLAERLGMPIHAYEQTRNPLADLARWARLADTPFPGAALAQYEEDFLRVRGLGLRNVLTGEHAEFVTAFQWNTLSHYLTHGRMRAARREQRQRRHRGQSWFGLLRLVARSLAPDGVMRARNAIGGGRPPTVPHWIDLRRASEEEPVPVRERWTRAQLAGFIGPGPALEAEEVCQAVCGVTVRRPWTDIDLWELFLGLPAEQKFPDLRAKGLVRDLLRGRVPDEILDRQDKTVFDEAMLAEIDYPTLRDLLADPPDQLAGVDYALLARRLGAENLTPVEYQWARNLAGVHAFLSEWR